MKRVVIPKLVEYISEMGCAACYRLGLPSRGKAEIHHVNAKGMGVRSGDDRAIGLCFLHHEGKIGVHHLGTRAWEKANGFTEEELLSDTHSRIRRDMERDPWVRRSLRGVVPWKD